MPVVGKPVIVVAVPPQTVLSAPAFTATQFGLMIEHTCEVSFKRLISGVRLLIDFIKALLHGGTIDIYHCGADEKCLNPTLSTHEQISMNDQSLVGRVEKILQELKNKNGSNCDGQYF